MLGFVLPAAKEGHFAALVVPEPRETLPVTSNCRPHIPQVHVAAEVFCGAWTKQRMFHA